MVTASTMGLTATATLTCGSPRQDIKELRIVPNNAEVPVTARARLDLYVVFTSGAEMMVASRTAMWSSSNTMIATVDSNGLLTARAAGMVTITATYMGHTGQATFTVVGR
jgi:uncharacterized protein YjdB